MSFSTRATASCAVRRGRYPYDPRALSIGFRVLVSLHPAIQATGRLALAPAGLTPARRTCLVWTRDHLIRPRQHRGRDSQAEGLGGLEVDDQLELRGPLDGQIPGFAPFRILST